MNNSDRDLHGDSYREWKEEKMTEYMENQRAAFMAGFEAAASEGKEFRQLRRWLEQQRDKAKERYESDSGDHTDYAQYMAYVNVLVKLSEMGCGSRESDV